MPKEDPEQTALQKELTDLIAKVKVFMQSYYYTVLYAGKSCTYLTFSWQAEQEKVADAKLAEKCGDLGDVPKIRFITKKTLKGHINKVNSVHYSGDSRWVSIVSQFI